MAEKTITEQIVREDPEIEAYRRGLLESAKALSDVQRTQPAFQVAGLPTDIQTGITQARAGIGAYQPFLTGAAAQVGAAPGQLAQATQAAQAAEAIGLTAPGYITGAMEAPTQAGLQPFMSPYQQSVIDESLAEINRQGQIQEQQVAAGAVQAGAFGGARYGVQQAELQRGLQERRNQITANLNQQNFMQAQAAFQEQQKRQMAGGQMLAQQVPQQMAAAQAYGDIGRLYGATGLQQAALGETTQKLGAQDVDMLTRVGQLQQKQSQAEIEAARQTELQTLKEPYERVSWLSDIYKGVPSSQQTVTQATRPSTSPIAQAAGIGLAGLTTMASLRGLGMF